MPSPIGRPLPGRSLHTILVYLLAVAALFTVLAGCAVRLAPDFDSTIVNGLTKVNQETMTLFASVSGGTSPGTSSMRKPTYDTLIGSVDALKVQAVARPAPRSFLGAGSSGSIAKLETPTPAILDAMIMTLTVLRDTDMEYGLRPRDVDRFKGEFTISMDQALTYEKALER